MGLLSAAEALRQLVTALFDKVKPDGSAFTLPVPENEEVVALLSAEDDASGRTSDELTNRYGQGVAILIDVTEATDATLSAVRVQMKVGAAWMSIAEFTSLVLTDVGPYAFLVYPGSALMTGWTATPVDSRVLRRYRIEVTTNANGSSKTMTYGVTCVHLL
jgi:hypothetical protein